MNVAVAGKGGAGKTTISATLARLAARGGRAVVAVDADSNPNLGLALGIVDEVPSAPLPSTLVSRRMGGPQLTAAVDEVVGTYGIPAPDGVRMLVMGAPGHADEGCMCAAHATVSAVLGDLAGSPDTLTIVDMEASPEHLSRGTARHADVIALVAEPYYRSLETVRRMAALARELPVARIAVVANKLRSDEDLAAIAEFCERHDLELLGGVPWDDAVVDADRRRVPLVEAAPSGPVVAAISAVLGRL